MRLRVFAACCLFGLALFPARFALAEPAGVEGELPPLSAYILMEAGTGQVILEQSAAESLPVAGLAKLPAILTLCQAFDDGSIEPEATVSVSGRAAAAPGPTAFLEEGEGIQAAELIKAAVMISAGDAILALTEHAYGSEGVMLDNMAVTMVQAGLVEKPDSVLGGEQGMSAQSLAALGRLAAKSAAFLRYSCLYLDGIPHADGRETELVNANRLLRFFPGAAGLLTGSSQAAGYSGVFYASRSNTNLLLVIIGARTNGERFDAAEKLFGYGFQNFTAKTLVKKDGVVAPSVTVRNGTERTVNLIAREDVTLLLPKNGGKLTENREIPELLEPPVYTDAPLGKVTYTDESGTVAAVIPLYADRAAEPFGLLDILRLIVREYVS